MKITSYETSKKKHLINAFDNALDFTFGMDNRIPRKTRRLLKERGLKIDEQLSKDTGSVLTEDDRKTLERIRRDYCFNDAEVASTTATTELEVKDD